MNQIQDSQGDFKVVNIRGSNSVLFFISFSKMNLFLWGKKVLLDVIILCMGLVCCWSDIQLL